MPARLIERCAKTVTAFPRASKIAIAVTVDVGIMPTLLAAALILKAGSFAAAQDPSLVLYGAASALTGVVFAAMGFYRAVFRFISRRSLFEGAIAVAICAVLLGVANEALTERRISGSALVIFALLALLYVVASRALVREWLYFKRGEKERVLIYGAGEAGAQLSRSLRDGGQYLPVAFIDDDMSLSGRLISGLKIYGPDAMPSLIEHRNISSVLLAIPSCSQRRRQSILKALEPYPVHVRTLPDISDIIAGHATVADVREVDPSDLLGRESVPPNQTLLESCIRGKVVMVSGAGGSIGSELCRQIVRLGPARLILVEMSEPALYHIHRELQLLCDSNELRVEIVALLGNAHHRNRAREIMHRYSVQTVYHAAAYKHVPIVEQNIIEGIHNNVFSSWYLAEAALDAKVETFVLISSDKAVNPTNVMGATKRMAELTLQALQQRSTSTRFCMVRFGNVLESSGSVVPLFREQIKRGGPITVTHRDIIRYFMTIPEASQLVLQAGAMGQGGDVFVLDMGEPLRIADLARRMVHLMGLTVKDDATPHGDIEIVYTGLRPAEKLYEELLISKNVIETEHPMIMRAKEPHLPWVRLKDVLAELLEALDRFDCARARELLMATVVEYRPESGIQDLVWVRGQQVCVESGDEFDAHKSQSMIGRMQGKLALVQ
jgi:FlaA1/EpsC-like NDP-sugar epimerase